MTDSLQDEWNRLVKQGQKNPAKLPTEELPPLPPPKPKGRWVLPALFVLSLGALALYFQGTLNPWPAKPSKEEIEAGHKTSLMLVSQAIHDYAAFHGRYPQRISEVLSLTVDIEYRQTADGFELRMMNPDGTSIAMHGK